ncbi:MOSC N-terminal beta barrel domain-containing protein [Streptomyces sp. B1866]|uniref:MOSC domain-containing protein n=1 Tax=Streptomyces sp. B1866 TaxID=3075431 RepID=UPI0028919ADA|nr:MOSC N-terminal beta barrel domain-containing protein [Streptomyces sp. B1866]MDT3400153.1 MOSC N-terminal beta barrel domain-containing protein [Streptomyces sp. B1866]
MAEVAELTYYPVKGCAGTSVAEALLTPAGLTHDRAFMVVDDDGVFRSQRADPRLAVIRPDVSADGGRMTLRAPGFEPVALAVDTTGERRDVRLFANRYRGIDQGEEAAGWLSEVLGAPSRLVRVPPEHDRVTDGALPGTSGYADSCAVLVTSDSSLAELNERIARRDAPAAARGGTGPAAAGPLPMTRFRPNIVVTGWPEPHTEDRARRIRLGAAELGYAKVAIRCSVTLVDQDSGAGAGPEPLRTLAAYRRAAQGGVAFGAKFAVVRPGKLSVGDELSVTTWGPAEL